MAQIYQLSLNTDKTNIYYSQKVNKKLHWLKNKTDWIKYLDDKLYSNKHLETKLSAAFYKLCKYPPFKALMSV